MTTNLGNHFQAQRLRRGLTLGQLARLLGYRNLSKGANRIARFERDGVVDELLLGHLAGVLAVHIRTVEHLVEQDRQAHQRAWEAWVSEPVPMVLIVRYLPALYGTTALPEGVQTAEDAEAYACAYARRHGRRVCLAVSRRQSIWINQVGEVEARTEATPNQANVPFLRLKGSRDGFLWGFSKKD
jgi:hypothetical protein